MGALPPPYMCASGVSVHTCKLLCDMSPTDRSFRVLLTQQVIQTRRGILQLWSLLSLRLNRTTDHAQRTRHPRAMTGDTKTRAWVPIDQTPREPRKIEKFFHGVMVKIPEGSVFAYLCCDRAEVHLGLTPHHLSSLFSSRPSLAANSLPGRHHYLVNLSLTATRRSDRILSNYEEFIG